jgi:hypothetical protein
MIFLENHSMISLRPLRHTLLFIHQSVGLGPVILISLWLMNVLRRDGHHRDRGGGRDSTSRVGPTPLDTVLALLCGGGGSFPSHTCLSIETQQATSLSGWRPPLPQIRKTAMGPSQKFNRELLRFIRLRTNCSDKTNKQIGNVFVSPFVLMSVLLFCVVK